MRKPAGGGLETYPYELPRPFRPLGLVDSPTADGTGMNHEPSGLTPANYMDSCFRRNDGIRKEKGRVNPALLFSSDFHCPPTYSPNVAIVLWAADRLAPKATS